LAAAERLVDARLPAGTGFAKVLDDVGVDPQLERLLGIIGTADGRAGDQLSSASNQTTISLRAPHACSRIFDFQVRPARSI